MSRRDLAEAIRADRVEPSVLDPQALPALVQEALPVAPTLGHNLLLFGKQAITDWSGRRDGTLKKDSSRRNQ